MRRFLSAHVLVVLIAIIPVLSWHLLNQTGPHNDAGDYALYGYQAYVKMKHNFFDGLRYFYLVRNWKALAFSGALIPALFLTGGSVKWAVLLTMVLCAGLLGSYLYRLVGLRLDPRSSFLLASFIALIPFVSYLGIYFMTELPFTVSVMGFLYHSWGEKIFKRDSDMLWATLWALVCFLIRPAEALLVLGLPLAVQFQHALKRKLYPPSMLLAIFAVLSVEVFWVTLQFLAYLRFHVHLQFNQLNPLGLVAMKLLPWLCVLLPFALVLYSGVGVWRRGWSKANLSLTLGLFVVAFWFIPFTEQLIYWIYQTTFGEFAQLTGGRQKIGTLEFLATSAQRLSWSYALLFVFLSWLLAMRDTDLSAWKKRVASFAPLSWLSAIGVVIAIGAFTQNGELRYYSAPTVLLFIVTAWLIRVHSEASRKLLRGVLSAILLFQVVYHYRFVTRHSLPRWAVLGQAPVPPQLNGDRFVATYSALKHAIGDHPKPAHVGYFGYGLREEWKRPDGWPTNWSDPWALDLIALEDGAGLRFNFEGGAVYYRPEDQLTRLRCIYHYLLIGPLEGDPDHVWDHGAKIGKFIVEHWHQGDLEQLGFIKPRVISPKGMTHFPVTYLVTEVVPTLEKCDDLRRGTPTLYWGMP